MQERSKPAVESRQDLRLKLSPMYTVIRVRPHGTRRFCWSGHIYDVSETGLRFEVDGKLALGTSVDVQATLPGPGNATVKLSGRIVRYHDEPEDLGPIRMGMVVDSFSTQSDHRRWLDYLRGGQLKKAA